MTLREKQSLFVRLLSNLFEYAHHVMHAELTLGEAWRTDEQAEIHALGPLGRERVATLIRPEFPALALALRNNGNASGIRLSLHGERLAIDLNLFIDGVLQTDPAAYRPLGEFWEGLDPSCAWGGRFNDAVHFSLRHGGRA